MSLPLSLDSIAYLPMTKSYPDFRILLVEDDAPNALVASTLLEMAGFEFDVVHNGTEAIEKAKSGLYRVIIMDLRLPDMHGIDATMSIREYERKTNQQPMHILCVTADALISDHKRCMDAGMNDYISKPYKLTELQHKLSEYQKKDNQTNPLNQLHNSANNQPTSL